jgi:hypothetical protein
MPAPFTLYMCFLKHNSSASHTYVSAASVTSVSLFYEQVLGSGAEEEMAAHIRQPHKGAVTPSWLAEQVSLLIVC